MTEFELRIGPGGVHEFAEVDSESSNVRRLTRTLTFTLNRAGDFISSTVVDLGEDGVHLIQATMNMLSFEGDGETLGNSPGTIYVGQGTVHFFGTNADGGSHFVNVPILPVSHFVAEAGEFVFELQGDDVSPSVIIQTARYLEVVPGIIANSTGLTYAGANDPAAMISVDLVYT